MHHGFRLLICFVTYFPFRYRECIRESYLMPHGSFLFLYLKVDLRMKKHSGYPVSCHYIETREENM